MEVLESFMKSQGICRLDLFPLLGRNERVYEELNRKQRLSLELIRRLSTGLGALLICGLGRKLKKQLKRAEHGPSLVLWVEFRPAIRAKNQVNENVNALHH